MAKEKLIVVTGAPGWLGTELVRTLTTGPRFESYTGDPSRVRCLVLPGADLAPLRALQTQVGDRLELHPCDLREPSSIEGACEGAEAVVHAAGIIHPRRIRDLYAVNVAGTKNLLAEATRAKVGRLVYVSSNAPAGLNLRRDEPMLESDAPRPYLNYGMSKLQAEYLVNDAHRSGRLESVILRPCWYYGPNQPARQTRFFKMIKGGHPLIFGDGSNLRSMCYIDNCVQGVVLALNIPRAAGQTYWITDRRPYPFIEIIRTVAELLGVEVRPRKLPSFGCDVARLVDHAIQATGLYSQDFHVAGELAADIAVTIDKAHAELGYDPEIALEEGMRRSIEWVRAQGTQI